MDPMPRDAITPGSVIVFYDGVCGFCNGAVRFVAERDRDDRFRFAPLQGALAHELLLAHDVNPAALDTIHVLVDYGLPDERVYSRADGIARVFRELGGLWTVLSVIGLLPEPILNRLYHAFAERRYRMFGKLEQCPIPAADIRRKFVEPGVGEASPATEAS